MKEEGKKRLATDWLNVNFLCGMKLIFMDGKLENKDIGQKRDFD